MPFFAVPVNILPGLGLDEGQLVGREANDGAVAVVEALCVVDEVPRLERIGEGDA